MKEQGLLMDVFSSVLEDTLFTITTQKQDSVVAVFMEWFTKHAQLKRVPDLQDRLAKMEPKLRKMAKNLKVSIEEGKIVIKSDAESENLLALLKRGSDWFEPHPDVQAAILLGLSSDERTT